MYDLFVFSRLYYLKVTKMPALYLNDLEKLQNNFERYDIDNKKYLCSRKVLHAIKSFVFFSPPNHMKVIVQLSATIDLNGMYIALL